MAKLDVKPTRMELLNLKRRLKSAKRGHKLLKDKQDGLMQQFMEIIRKAKSLRQEVEESLGEAFKAFMLASLKMDPATMEEALMFPKATVALQAQIKNVMSVRIPVFELETAGTVHAYGFAQTSGQLDIALEAMQTMLKTLVELAEIEQSAKLLSLIHI